LNPEAGGTERITSLVQRGLTKAGYHCMDILELDVSKRKAVYHVKEIEDIYGFLKENSVDVVINQWGQLPDFLRFFLDNGGKRWHKEGGRIISCLHFDPKMIDYYHELNAKENKTIKDYINLVKSKIFYKHYANKDMIRLGKTYREVYDMSDKYILLSRGFIPYFKKAAQIKDLSKLVCINNPLTFEKSSEITEFGNKQNIILIVSRMYERQKRILLALKVWKILMQRHSMKEWQLKIVGDGPDIERYKNWSKKNGLQRISFEGQQSPEPYYDEAKLFLMTSIMEGWGLTLTESLQKGVVSISFDTCAAFHDIITDGENGYLVKEGAIKTFASKIEQLAQDKQLWLSMAENALASANCFNLDKITKDWEKII
jgi:glycosyltransferase involved in cell wall biosynthesis